MTSHDTHWFPGRVIGGCALILGPLLWMVALVLRWLPFEIGVFTDKQIAHFEAQPVALTGELNAYQAVPELVITGYAVFLVSVAVLMPAYLTLARLVGERHRRLAWWGAVLVCLSLLARFYHTGVEQTAFQLSDDYGLDWAIQAISANYGEVSYGPWRVPVWFSVGQIFGMLMLLVAAHRSGLLGTVRCLLMMPTVWMWMGVLKGSELIDIAGAALACVVLIPLGVQVLRERVPARESRLLSWLRRAASRRSCPYPGPRPSRARHICRPLADFGGGGHRAASRVAVF
ncbi:MAG: hypothetical protein ACRD0P_15280 [Stackebrandtia sp.]